MLSAIVFTENLYTTNNLALSKNSKHVTQAAQTVLKGQFLKPLV